MKKIVLGFIAFILLTIGAIALLIYRWTITPFGRLHPVMAVIHQLFSQATSHGSFDRNDIPKVREMMKLAKPHVPVAEVTDSSVEAADRSIPLRIYRPEGQPPFPVIVFFHGGGFTIGCIESHENVARSLAKFSSAVVVSVEYRLAPEHPFPAALDDSFEAVKWTAANVGQYGGDPTKLAVAGDSAGGNLAAAVSLKARDEGGPSIGLQILLYPTLVLTDTSFPSRRNFAGYILTEDTGAHVLEAYLPNKADRLNPYASPMLAKDHSNLPPAYIMTAAFDPLLDEGAIYSQMLEEAGVPVAYHRYEGMLHGFLSYGDIVSYFPPLVALVKEPDQVYQEVARAVERWLR